MKLVAARRMKTQPITMHGTRVTRLQYSWSTTDQVVVLKNAADRLKSIQWI